MKEPVTNVWMRACGKWLLICLLFLAWIVPVTISAVAVLIGVPALDASERLWTKIKAVRGVA